MSIHYSTYPVTGDTETPVQNLKPGDTVRLYTGIDDTATVVSVSADYTQTGKWYEVDLGPFGIVRRYRQGDTMRLATGGPRTPLQPA